MPKRFWSELELTSHARAVRLVACAALGVVLVTVLAGFAEFGLESALRHNRQVIWHTVPQGGSSHFLSPSVSQSLINLASAVFAPFGLYTWYPGAGWMPVPIWEYWLAPLLAVLCPLVYLLVPVTLRRCRVRRVHLLRAFAFGLPATAVVCELLFLLEIVVLDSWWWGTPLTPVLNPIGYLAEAGVPWMVVLFAWQSWWWWSVNRRYLKLANPLGVTAAMITIASLGTLIILFAFTPTGIELMNLLSP